MVQTSLARADARRAGRKLWVGLVIASLLAAAAYALARRGGGDVAAAARTKAEAQAAAPSGAVRAGGKVAAEARVVPVRSVALGFQSGGTVAQVMVAEGDRVEAGQLLARLDTARQEASVAQAEAELRRARARLAELRAGPRPQELEAASAKLEAAQLELTRARVAGAPIQVRLAEAEVRGARANLELVRAGPRPEAVAAAEAEVAALQHAVEQAKATLSQAELRAPFAGVIAFLDARPGEVAAPGTPVVRVADTSAWRLETEDLTEVKVVNVRKGNRATITFDAIPGLDMAGTVEGVRGYGEKKQGDITYRVVIRLDRQDPRLRWNMTATVAIDAE